MQKLEMIKLITRETIRKNPNKLYVFGDNNLRIGLGGQAKEARGEINTHGISTKRKPSNNSNDFFNDSYEDMQVVLDDLLRLTKRSQLYDKVVWPVDNIGTGLAELPIRSPKIFNLINSYLDWLEVQ